MKWCASCTCIFPPDYNSCPSCEWRGQLLEIPNAVAGWIRDMCEETTGSVNRLNERIEDLKEEHANALEALTGELKRMGAWLEHIGRNTDLPGWALDAVQDALDGEDAP